MHNRNIEVSQRTIRRLYVSILNENSQSQIASAEALSCKIEIEKVFRHIRNAVNNQLPKEGPGIVLIESPYALDWNKFEDAARKRFDGRKKYPNLSAIVLDESLFTGGCIRHNLKIILNPQATIDISAYATFKVLNNFLLTRVNTSQ